MEDFFKDSELNEKEKRILYSAIKIFGEKGFSGSTTSEIAKDAKVSEGTIFRYFRTKKDILRAILIIVINYGAGMIIMNPIERIICSSNEKELKTVLREIILDRIKVFENMFPMIRILLTEALYHNDIREVLFEKVFSKAIDFYGSYHKKMQEKNIIKENISAEAALRCIMGNIILYIAQKNIFNDYFKEVDFEEELGITIEIILKGIER